MRNVYEEDGAYILYDICEEEVDGASGEIGQSQKGSFFVSEDAQFILGLDGEVLYDLSYFE